MSFEDVKIGIAFTGSFCDWFRPFNGEDRVMPRYALGTVKKLACFSETAVYRLGSRGENSLNVSAFFSKLFQFGKDFVTPLA